VVLEDFVVLPKPATRCPPVLPPPTPPAVRSQAEVAMALPSSLLSPAPLWAFLALYPEPAAGSGCASISSAHDPSAAICEHSSEEHWWEWGMRTLVRQEVAQRHLLNLLLGSCNRRVSVLYRCAIIARLLRRNPISAALPQPTDAMAQHIRAKSVPTHVCSRKAA
jgi:hypothetical protein